MWFKKANSVKFKEFLHPTEVPKPSLQDVVNRFIDDFNEEIKKGRFELTTNSSKAACDVCNNVVPEAFRKLQAWAERKGYSLIKIDGHNCKIFKLK